MAKSEREKVEAAYDEVEEHLDRVFAVPQRDPRTVDEAVEALREGHDPDTRRAIALRLLGEPEGDDGSVAGDIGDRIKDNVRALVRCAERAEARVRGLHRLAEQLNEGLDARIEQIRELREAARAEPPKASRDRIEPDGLAGEQMDPRIEVLGDIFYEARHEGFAVYSEALARLDVVDPARRLLPEIVEVLEGVIAEADRETVAFKRARGFLARIRALSGEEKGDG